MSRAFPNFLLRHRWRVLAAAMAGLVLLYWWNKNRPIATLVLPNRTTILLRKLSAGPEHTYYEEHRPNVSILERIRHPSGQLRSINSHSPVLFLTESTPKRWGETTAELDEVQRRYAGAGGPISEVSVDDNSSEFTIVHSFNYPRREKTMRLNLSIKGEWHEWELPNPLYGTAFPEWKAQPFPQTIKEGDFEFTATGWALEKTGFYSKKSGWNLAGEARYRGEVVAHRIVIDKTEDATGNHGDPALMPMSEPAWKVQTSIVFGAEKPLAPERLVDFGETRVPDSHEYFILPMPPAMGQGQKTFTALVGTGTFAFRDGVYSPQDAPVAQPSRPYSNVGHHLKGNSWVVRGEVVMPTFVMFEITDQPAPTFASEQLHLKFSSAKLERQPQGSNAEVTHGPPFTRKLGWIEIRSFSVGTPIRIRSVRPERFRWELLVPPISPAERASAGSSVPKE